MALLNFCVTDKRYIAPGQLVYITDQLTQRRLLVDTGAAYSVIPHSSTSLPNGLALAGATGRPIPYWGEKQFHLFFCGQAFSWSFLLAAVQFLIGRSVRHSAG